MKVRCENHRCGWRGDDDETLVAKNPFEPDYLVSACPRCKVLLTTCVDVCEEPDCWEPATMGTPSPSGYKRHCHKHPPKELSCNTGAGVLP